MSKRSEKLTRLSEFVDLETGDFKSDVFDELELLYTKGRRFHKLAQVIRKCHECPGMNVCRVTEACPGWGNLNADVMIVGQSLHEPGMYSQVPFILGSGLLVDAALSLSGINRQDCFWTNAVLCHPERNRASTEEEKRNCLGYLFTILDIVKPKVVVALGKDAKESVDRCVEEIGCEWKYLRYVHPASLIYSAPEAKPNWIVKMSLDLDKILKGQEK